MPVTVTELQTENGFNFQSTDRTIGHYILRQQHLLIAFLVWSIVFSTQQKLYPFLQYVNPLCLILLLKAPIIEIVEPFPQQGIQITCTGGLLLLPEYCNRCLFSNVRFIPQDDIEQLFVNEGFKGLQVIYYLAMTLKHQDRLEVLFEVCHVMYYGYFTNSLKK